MESRRPHRAGLGHPALSHQLPPRAGPFTIWICFCRGWTTFPAAPLTQTSIIDTERSANSNRRRPHRHRVVRQKWRTAPLHAERVAMRCVVPGGSCSDSGRPLWHGHDQASWAQVGSRRKPPGPVGTGPSRDRGARRRLRPAKTRDGSMVTCFFLQRKREHHVTLIALRDQSRVRVGFGPDA